MILSNIKNIHFIGIGGAGMSGIAEILFYCGYNITGSDVFKNMHTKRLLKKGIKIFFEHNAKNIENSCIVVVSTAINHDNPEIIAAKKFNIPIVHRSYILAKIMKSKFGIAISGTHGKTTTTSMIVGIYVKSGLDPTFINGALIKSENSCARLGLGKHIIVEADESDGSFLQLAPINIVITNIGNDHICTYYGSLIELKRYFINFLNRLPTNGLAVVCIDDSVIRSILPEIKCKIITYGFRNEADFRISSFYYKNMQSFFTIRKKNKEEMFFVLNSIGEHNILNASAAIALSLSEKIDNKIIFKALQEFKGTDRRFDIFGDVYLKNFKKKIKVKLINDYGHCPREIETSISVSRHCWPKKRVFMIFQPHKFSRTKYFFNDFVIVLEKVDVLLILDVYSAGEKLIEGFDSANLCTYIRKNGKINPLYIRKNEKIFDILADKIRMDDIVILQGAGNVNDIKRYFSKFYI